MQTFQQQKEGWSKTDIPDDEGDQARDDDHKNDYPNGDRVAHFQAARRPQ